MHTPAFSGSATSVASHEVISKAPAPKKGPVGPSMNTNKESSMPSKGAKIPRAPNALILYVQYHHPKISEDYPDFQINDICKLRNPGLK